MAGLTSVLVVGPSRSARARETLLVEDWSGQALGARGVPRGWRKYETPGGHAAYDFSIVDDEGRRALELRSHRDHSTIAKEVTVNLEATPRLQWSWRVRRFPAGADLRRKETSDATGHVFVVWPRVPALLRSRLIGYVWDRILPVNTVITSRKTRTVTFVVVRTGAGGGGTWQDEERDVAEDYRRVFAEVAPAPAAVALSIDTNDTQSGAETLIGTVRFAGRTGPS